MDEVDSHPGFAAPWRTSRSAAGRLATASLVRLIENGALRIRIVDALGIGSTIEFALVPGSSTAARPSHPPFVPQGRVEGLTKTDRLLLSIVFDRIAGSPATTLFEMQRFAADQPWHFWRYIKEWRRLLRREQQVGPRLSAAVLREAVHRAAPLYRKAAGEKSPVEQLIKLFSPRYPFGYSPPARAMFVPLTRKAKGLIMRADEE